MKTTNKTKEAAKRDKEKYQQHITKLNAQLEATVEEYEQKFAELEEEKTKRSKETITGTE